MAAHSDSSSDPDPTGSQGSTAAGAHAAGASAGTHRIVASDRDATHEIPVERTTSAPAGQTHEIPVERAVEPTHEIPVERPAEQTRALPVERPDERTNAIPVEHRTERTDALPVEHRADATQVIPSRPAAELATGTTVHQPPVDPSPTAGHSTLPAMAAPAAAAPPVPADVPAAPTGQATRQQVVAAQKERFGGLSWGAAFFGWLSANGMAVLLIALLSAGGLAFGLSDRVASVDAAADSATSGIGLGAGIALLVALFLAYLAGGYVAGRMARFDGARQGVGVWVIGLVVVVLLALAGLLFGAQYNVLARLDLPRIPIDEGTATTAGVIALVAVLLVTLIGAVLGGLLGTRYHRKVDRVGFDAV